MLIDYAFHGENVDVLHCISKDYNPRSYKIWEKNSFTRILEEKQPDGLKGKWQYHYSLTRKSFIDSKREVPCYIDNSDIDENAYKTDNKWCKDENIGSVADLAERVVSHKDFEML